MAGRVTRLAVEQGETAVPGTFNKDAATLLTISDMSVLETRVKVDETDVARIKVGDSAQVQIDAFPDTTFLGRVTKISNSSVKAAQPRRTDQAVDYEVTIQLLNAPIDTRPDFSATAKVITDKRNGRAVGPDHRADGPGEPGDPDRATPRWASVRPSPPRTSAKRTSKACSWSAPTTK